MIFLRLGSLFLSCGLVPSDFLVHLRSPAPKFVHPFTDQRIELLSQSPDFVDVVAFDQAANQCGNFIGHANILTQMEGPANLGSRHLTRDQVNCV